MAAEEYNSQVTQSQSRSYSQSAISIPPVRTVRACCPSLLLGETTEKSHVQDLGAREKNNIDIKKSNINIVMIISSIGLSRILNLRARARELALDLGGCNSFGCRLVN